MTLDSGALDHLCRLARLELPAEEAAALRADLARILDYVAVLQRTRSKSEEPHRAPIAETGTSPRDDQPRIRLAWREDLVRWSAEAADALSQAPEFLENHFAVPTVVVSEAKLSRGGSDARTTDGIENHAATLHALGSAAEPPSGSSPGSDAGRSEFHLPRSVAYSEIGRLRLTTATETLFESAEEILARISTGDVSARSAVEACLIRITQAEPRVLALVSVDHEAALARADELDQARAAGDALGSLHGLPIVIKDNLAHRGRPLQCASRILGDYHAAYTATAVERLEQAGAIVIGRANMDEFAMGSSCENSAFGATANPWDLTRVPGGSSGGSAAAVAAGEAWVSLGSDTGGSVRQPGAFCGLVALKPRYGRVSRHGLVAFASSLDQIGPLGRWARDVALVYNAIQGVDPLDATSAPGDHAIDLARLDGTISGIRLGVPRGWLGEGVDPEIVRALESTLRVFESLGVEMRDVELPSPRDLIATYYVLANAEASSNLARFDGVRYGRRASGAPDLDTLYRWSRGEGFGVEVKRRILIGTFVLSAGYYDAYYGEALRVRDELREQMNALRNSVEAILLPAAPTTAFRLGEKLQDPLSMYLSDLFTIGANLIGNAAVTFPAGKSSEGLPVGMQLYGCGDRNDEELLLRLVRAFELASDGLGSLADPVSPLMREWGRA